MGNLVHAQISPSFTQFFINPYRLNPSYAGVEGRPVIYLAHRQQWVGIEDAPVTTSFSFHAPLNFGVSVGADIYSDQRGLLNTNSLLLTGGYTISFSKKDFLRFGLSGGMGFRNIDLSQVDNPTDPALFNVVDNNFFLNGNFGISFHTGYFSLGIAMPNLFEPNINNTNTFENGTIAPLKEIIVNTSYRFYFALDNMAFEPHVTYRYSDILPHQYEAAGILHLKHVVWVGGSYRQDYGVSGLAGIKLNNRLLVGYSYGMGFGSLPGIGKSTHEFNLSMQLGRERRSRRKIQDVHLSFINTERDYWDPGTARRTTAGQTTTRPTATTRRSSESQSTQDPSRDTQAHDNPRLAMGTEFKDRAVTDVPTENISAGDHEFELSKGNYIVVREFETEKSAGQYTDKIEEQGERAGFGYVTRRGKWMVYVYRSDSRLGLRRRAEKVRSESEFSDAKIVVIE